MEKKNFKGISTITLHTASHEHDNFSHTTPIYATSTFTFGSAEEGMERFKGDDKTRLYTRWGNPTFTAAEQTIEALEASLLIELPDLTDADVEFMLADTM